MAVNCSLVPSGIELFAGVTAMDWSVRATTDRVVEPVIRGTVAEILAEPAATGVARPDEVIVATDVLEDFHVKPLDNDLVLPSEYVSVAVN